MSNMTIEQIQQEFIKDGIQWIEHIFNDGNPDDCSIKFTKSKNPSYFTYYCVVGDLGWGRFPRSRCWNMAYEWLLESREGKKEWPEPKTSTYEQIKEHHRKEKAKRRKRLRWYVGMANGVREVFQSLSVPIKETHPQYNSVIGPFKTKRGAIYMEKHGGMNPHVVTVDDAERLAKFQT